MSVSHLTTHFRIIKRVADDVLDRMSGDFDSMYSKIGRASVPPERLLKSLLLISLYSIRSERAFCQELDYNLLYRWFLDMDLMEPSFDATVYSQRTGGGCFATRWEGSCSRRWRMRQTTVD